MRPASQSPAAFIAFAAALGLFVRIWFAYDAVLGGPFVRFAENDPWYHMRLVENLLHHFPQRIAYDPYLLFGGGQNVAVAPFLDLLIAAVALIAGLGSPSPSMVEHVGACMPALLGALCVLPAYGLGRTLFSTRAGLLAAGLTAILPGQFLARSSLGFTDHHVAEALLSACTMLFVVRALDSRQEHSRSWCNAQAVCSGLFLGAYLLNWAGGGLLVVVIGVAALASVAFGRDTHLPGRVLTAVSIAFGVAALIVAPFLSSWTVATSHLAVLAAVGITTLLFAAAVRIVESGRSRWMIALAAVAVMMIAFVLFERLAPISADVIRGYVARLSSASGPRVAEALPLFSVPIPAPLLLFVEFGISIYLALVAALFVMRSADAGKWVLLVMFAAALVLTVQQVRFSYYLAIPVAVIAGYACDRILAVSGRRQEIVFLALVLIVFVPNAQLARLYADSTSGPSDDWHEALTWLRANSPEPFGDAAVFDADYTGMSEQRPHPLSAHGYGVTAWWDRGYWITRIARRVPSANPTQAGAARVANVFLASDDQTAIAAIDRLRARYVIVDDSMPPRWLPRRQLMVGVLPDAIATQGLDPDDYYQVYERRLPDGSTEPVLLFYPPYYQTLAIRLLAFGGRAVRPQSVVVAMFHEERHSGGVRLLLDELRPFASVDAAAQFIREAPASRRLVGTDPVESCIPLDALTALVPVHHSAPAGTVRIFERRKL